MAGYVASTVREALRIWFWWGTMRDRPLGRPRRKWEYNLKMDLQEMG
jgi:hypothetical protein